MSMGDRSSALLEIPKFVALALALVIVLCVGQASAHRLDVDTLSVRIQQNSAEISGQVLLDPDVARPGGAQTEIEAAAKRVEEAHLLAFIQEHVFLSAGGERLELSLQVRELYTTGGAVPGDSVMFRAQLPLSWRTLSVQIAEPLERMAVSTSVDGGADSTITIWGRSPLVLHELEDPVSPPSEPELAPEEQLLSYIWMGAIHILPLGWAHILFVIALALGSLGKFRRLILELSAFTFAHALTLALRATKLITVGAMRKTLATILLVAAGLTWACSRLAEDGALKVTSVCPATQTNCDGQCVDLTGDGLNCSACGFACGADQVCSESACQSSCTEPGRVPCENSCVDLQTNPSHCGGCGVPCTGDETCQSGSCAPSASSGGAGGVSVGTGGVSAGGAGGGISFGTEVLIEEGDLGQCAIDGVVETTNAGFSGSGYLNSDNGVGAAFEWVLHIGQAGTYSVTFVYANGGTVDRPADVLVGGVSAGGDVSFPPTDDWTTWSTVSVDVNLVEGENRVLLSALTDEGLANIDSFQVTGAAVNALGCEGIVEGAGGADGAGGNDGVGPGTCGSPTGHYQMEDLDRGLVAVRSNNGNYVGWRMLGYEYNRDNPSAVSYNLYRDGALIANVTDSTNYFDAGAAATAAYSVSVIQDGTECEQSGSVTAWEQNYLRVPLRPISGYTPNDTQPADLDGDGQYELVVKWYPDNSKDNSQSGVTSNTILEGLELDGTSLWWIDLGRNIRSGAHYTQMSIYDFDGDGRAEISVKTAPGTKDASGDYLSLGPAANDDDSADYRDGDGYVLGGPEYLSVFDGLTGAELATVAYPIPRGNINDWGDGYGNRVDRFNGGVAMVTDSGTNTGRPSIIQQRGYYTRLTMSSYHWRDGQLTKNWIFDSNNPGNSAAAGQGDHSAMTADMDGDGGQEITTGALTIGSDGTLRCRTGHGHGDAMHVGELIPGQGITVFTVYEEKGGYSVHDGNTCETYAMELGGEDNGRGVAGDIDPSSPGAECWSSKKPNLLSCSDGSVITSTKPESQNFLIYWDADETRELQDAAWIGKFTGSRTETLLDAAGCAGNNGTKNTPNLTADLFGDWREELVVRESNNSALRIYTTTDVTERRIYTLMHDPTYRMQVTWEQSSYNQPPHPGFHIGNGMADPPEPDIHVR